MIAYIWNGLPPGMFLEKKKIKNIIIVYSFQHYSTRLNLSANLFITMKQDNKKENLLAKSKILFKGQKSLN